MLTGSLDRFFNKLFFSFNSSLLKVTFYDIMWVSFAKYEWSTFQYEGNLKILTTPKSNATKVISHQLRRRGKNCAFLKNVEFITYANYWKFHRPKLLLSTSPFWSSPEKLVRPRPDLLPQPPFVHKSGSCRLQTDWNLQVLCSLSITKQVSFSAQRAKVFYPIVCQS